VYTYEYHFTYVAGTLMARKSKLTLSIDEDVVRHAKQFTSERDTSISELVERFLAGLGRRDDETSSVVAGLRGVLPEDVTVEEYRAHLEDRYGE
jgi:hypothetical protein